jgi:hypothetical protein
MKFEPVDYKRDSNITFALRRWARESRPYITVVHVAFSGNYRDGSAGAPDAHHINGVINTISGAWYPSAMIIDFSDLTYEWGDEMSMFIPTPDDTNALVVGDKCRRALTTLCTREPDGDIANINSVFDNFDDACSYVAKKQVESWNNSIRRSSTFDESELISLEHLGYGG